MIDREHYELIGQKHGSYASWAVWTPAANTPKSNVGDLSLFDVAAHPATLEVLKSEVIMVGLNISRSSLTERFRNFHDPSPRANDFKIRYAFTETRFYGAYMTDILKNLESVDSKDVLRRLRSDPAIARGSAEIFRDELKDLRARRPAILAFGHSAYTLVAAAMSRSEYSFLARLTHYSHRIGKEAYKTDVLQQVSMAIAHDT